MLRMIVYCQSLNFCADVYAFFLSSLGADSYYPLGAPELSDNRLECFMPIIPLITRSHPKEHAKC